MPNSFDPVKSEKNRAERGLPFDAVDRFVWSTCIIGPTTKQEPTATRYFALGLLDEYVHLVVFNVLPDGVRVISLRRANKKERNAWSASRTHT